jgi:hypothetical protein
VTPELVLAAAHTAAKHQTNTPGWILLIVLIAIGVWALGRWLRS